MERKKTRNKMKNRKIFFKQKVEIKPVIYKIWTTRMRIMRNGKYGKGNTKYERNEGEEEYTIGRQ